MGFSSVWNEITARVNVLRAHGQCCEREVGDNRAYTVFNKFPMRSSREISPSAKC